MTAFSIAIVGCGAGTMPPASIAASAKQALIAQPCAQMPANQEASGGYPRVFIQVAQVVSSDLHQPLESWLVDRAVGTTSVISFVGAKDAPTTVSWTRCLDAACESSEPWKLTVTPALPARASDPVLLSAQLQREQGSTADPAQSTTLETRNQQPIVVDLDGTVEERAWSLVVTPYLVGDDEDLRRLAECKRALVATE